MMAQRVNGEHLGIAFAWADAPNDSRPRLDVSFQVRPQVQGYREGSIRVGSLKLNGTRIPTTFSFPYRVEAFRNALHQNYPNPFNPETWIPFELSEAATVDLTIYNIRGEPIRTLNLGYRQPGYYDDRAEAAHWDGRNEHGEAVASGVYFYELRAGEFRDSHRMVILK